MKIQLVPEGVTQVDRLSEHALNRNIDHPGEFLLGLRAGDRLADLTEDWVIFTLAVPCLLKLPSLVLLATETPGGPLTAPSQAWRITTASPLFIGLFDATLRLDYNSHLWLVPRDRAQGFTDWLGTLAFNSGSKFFRVRVQPLTVPNLDGLGTFDPAATGVPVTAAVVETNGGYGLVFQPHLSSTASIRWRAQACRLDNPELGAFASAWQREDSKPYGAEVPPPVAPSGVVDG